MPFGGEFDLVTELLALPWFQRCDARSQSARETTLHHVLLDLSVGRGGTEVGGLRISCRSQLPVRRGKAKALGHGGCP